MTRAVAALVLAGIPLVLASCKGPTAHVVEFLPGDPTVENLAASCPQGTEAPTDIISGPANHGRYRNQRLPRGWDELPDEAAVTRAIAGEEAGPGWPCFAKFYGGTTIIYLAIKKGSTSASSAPTR